MTTEKMRDAICHGTKGGLALAAGMIFAAVAVGNLSGSFWAGAVVSGVFVSYVVAIVPTLLRARKKSLDSRGGGLSL